MTENVPIPSGTPSDASESGARAQRIGVLLHRTREGRRIPLADAAATLRIRVPYLEAIEKGNSERLPGPVYAVGFVRAYAEYLGLDGEEAARRFKREGQGLDHQPDLALPMPVAERSIPGGRILITALVLAVCGYGLWYYLGAANRGQPDLVAAVPPALQTEASTPNEAKAAVKEPGGIVTDTPKPGVPNSTASAPAPQNLAVVGVPTPPPAALTPLPTSDPGHVYGVAEGPVRIVLRFTGDCWMQVKGGGPDADLGKLMHSGDVYRVPETPGLTVRVGNSDTLTILVDGRTVTLPKSNSLVRNINLDPAQLLAWAGPPAATPAAATIPAAATAPAIPAPTPAVKAAPAADPATKAPPPDLPEDD